MNAETLAEELVAMCNEHDEFIKIKSVPNATSSIYYVELLRRMARTFDEFALNNGLDGRSDVATRVISVLGSATFVADMSFALTRGNPHAATAALGRWFSDERLRRLVREANETVTPGEG